MIKRETVKLILVGVLLALSVLAVVLFIRGQKYQQVEPFDSEGYQIEIEAYERRIREGTAEEIYVGLIEDPRDARKKAEKALLPIYGNIRRQRPYRVYHDAANGVWMVEGVLRSPLPFLEVDGGVAVILLRESDGKVLAVWHGK